MFTCSLPGLAGNSSVGYPTPGHTAGLICLHDIIDLRDRDRLVGLARSANDDVAAACTTRQRPRARAPVSPLVLLLTSDVTNTIPLVCLFGRTKESWGIENLIQRRRWMSELTQCHDRTSPAKNNPRTTFVF